MHKVKDLVPQMVNKIHPVVRITRNFQVTIPAALRPFTHFQEGDYVKSSFVKGKIIFESIKDIDEEIAWKQLGEQQLLDGYSAEDAIYDNYDEEIKKI